MPPSEKDKKSFSEMNQDVGDRPQREQIAQVSANCPLKRRERFRVILRDPDFRLYRDRNYVLTAGSDRFEGSTGSNGLVDHLIEEDLPSAVLTVWLDEAKGAEPYEWDFSLRKLHPVAVETGVQGRLHNLAFDSGEQGEEAELRLRTASGDFQALFGQEAESNEEPDSWLDEQQPLPQIEQEVAQVYEALDFDLLDEPEAWIPTSYKPQPVELM